MEFLPEILVSNHEKGGSTTSNKYTTVKYIDCYECYQPA